MMSGRGTGQWQPLYGAGGNKGVIYMIKSGRLRRPPAAVVGTGRRRAVLPAAARPPASRTSGRPSGGSVRRGLLARYDEVSGGPGELHLWRRRCRESGGDGGGPVHRRRPMTARRRRGCTAHHAREHPGGGREAVDGEIEFAGDRQQRDRSGLG